MARGISKEVSRGFFRKEIGPSKTPRKARETWSFCAPCDDSRRAYLWFYALTARSSPCKVELTRIVSVMHDARIFRVAIALTLLGSGCGGKRDDDATAAPTVESAKNCITVTRDGKEFLLCEKPATSDAERAAIERESNESRDAERAAQRERDRAVRGAQDAQTSLDRLARDASDLDAEINEAVNAVAGAQSDADRNAANTSLTALRRKKAELDARVNEAKRRAAAAERAKGVRVSPECQANPLARGCM